jgi:hypothetical protein
MGAEVANYLSSAAWVRRKTSCRSVAETPNLKFQAPNFKERRLGYTFDLNLTAGQPSFFEALGDSCADQSFNLFSSNISADSGGAVLHQRAGKISRHFRAGDARGSGTRKARTKTNPGKRSHMRRLANTLLLETASRLPSARTAK